MLRWGEPLDYIIFGIGTGATLLLIGWVLREAGPALRDRRSRAAAEVLGAQQLVDQMRWSRFCAACGGALAMGGALLLLVTAIAMLVSPTDTGGVWAVLVTFGIVSVAMLVWAWLFVSRFGIAGIYRAKPAAPPIATATEADDVRDDRDDHDDAVGIGDTASARKAEQDLVPPVIAPDPGTGPSPVAATLVAPAVEGEAVPVAAEEPSTGEVQRVRIEGSEGDDAGAGDRAGDDADVAPELVDADAGDRQAEPAESTVVTLATNDEPGPSSRPDHDVVEPVVDSAAVADLHETSVQTTVPVPERWDEPSAAAPEEVEHSDDLEAVPVPGDPGPPEEAGEGEHMEDAPAPASGRAEALRRLRQRRRR